MTGDPSEIRVEAAAVSDRGLSEKRPLNEDSFISDVERGIFAVADGVGGAEAGEVASQTAVEVLGEAFRHHRNGDDVEDLMEIAIQRANDSIHRMAHESPRLATMATTIVALHLDGLRATVGHVGDSRLYRIDSGGAIHRETEDHSIVEEEVRAGRMTPEQARHHPSRNVISRALGAEPSVEVDLKTLEVESGTTFLLCSDGITRHISDAELSEVVGGARSLGAACDELKRRCFERGAEDNLTAVLIRVGEAGEDFFTTLSGADEEATLVMEKARPAAASNSGPADAGSRGEARSELFQRPFDNPRGDAAIKTVEPSPPAAPGLTAASSQAAAPPDSPAAAEDYAGRGSHQEPRQEAPARRSGGAAGALAFLFLLAAASAAAFYAGMRFQDSRAATEDRDVAAVATPESTPAPTPAPSADFESRKLAVDRSPAPEAARMSALLTEQPANGEDPFFLYLYGRSLLRSGNDREAAARFEQAARKIQDGSDFTSDKASLLIDAHLATVAALVGSNDVERARQASENFKATMGSAVTNQATGTTPPPLTTTPPATTPGDAASPPL